MRGWHWMCCEVAAEPHSGALDKAELCALHRVLLLPLGGGDSVLHPW